MLSWFDAHPDYYWWIACVVTAVVLALLLRPITKAGWEDRKGADWPWGLAILAMLTAGRWPTWFVTRQMNEDESGMISGALTLRHDPIFWRSVDGATVGPLNFYALLPAGWLNGTDNYGSARITGMLLLAAALILTHQAIALVFGRQVARVATFGAAYLEAFTLHFDLLEYNTEAVSILLLAFAFWAGLRRFYSAGGLKWNLAGGLALGLLPFAKLQAVPMGLLLGGAWIIGEFRITGQDHPTRTRRLSALCLAAIAPLLLVTAILLATGQGRNAFVPYILENFVYTAGSEYNLMGMMSALSRHASREATLMPAWIFGCSLWVLLSLPFPRDPAPRVRLTALLAVALLAVSVGAVLLPHRPYPHYFQFLVMPGSLVLGAVTGLVLPSPEDRRARWRPAILAGALICSLGFMVHDRAGAATQVGRLQSFQASRLSAVSREIMKYARPGDSLGVWGFMFSCYAETGLRRATRTGVSIHEIDPGPYRDYFRERYLADLQRQDPSVFIDTVGPANFYYKTPEFRHETQFPVLAAYIKERYTLVAELLDCRIYARNDRLPPAVR